MDVEENERLRLDLAHSELLRESLVEKLQEMEELRNTVRDVAKDMLHALELLESAFYAGADYNAPLLVKKPRDVAFREWFQEVMK